MTTALVVLDVQESFRQRPLWQTISDPDIVTPVHRLVQDARARSRLVVWVLHTEPGSGGPFDPAQGHVRLMSGLEAAPGEPVLTKTSHNAFTTTNLQQILTTHRVSDVLICGLRTEQCCETTARLASDLGYGVTFVVDATATNPIEHPDAVPGRTVAEIVADPRTLPSEQIIERTAYALAGRFATISTVDEVIGPVAVPS